MLADTAEDSMEDAPLALPTSAEELRDAILARYDALSKRLQQVARYVLDHPEEMALQTLSVIAARSGSQPSAIVRFAKSLGFSGAGPMQQLLRDNFLAQNNAIGYGERVHQFKATVDQSVNAHGVGVLIDEFTQGDINALRNVRDGVGQEGLARAVELLESAKILHVAGMRRAFPVAAYFAYALPRAGKPTILLDGVGGLVLQQARAVGPGDVLIAISYHAYASETVAAVDVALAAGAKVLAISDSLLSPIAKLATQTLLVRESEVRGFRSLAASLCVAQALVVGLAYRLESARGAGDDADEVPSE